LQVVVGSEDLAANHDVMQIVEVLDDRARDSRLVALLDKYHRAQRYISVQISHAAGSRAARQMKAVDI
jgi:hypothetical protein